MRFASPEESAPTVGAALASAIARLCAAGVAEPEADAQVLLAHALATSRAGVIAAARDPLGPAAAVRLESLLSRRAAREPVAYVVGVREFWSLPLAVDRRVLIPRPETELLVETALRRAAHARRVLDAGTGSGAVAAALARELPRATVWASDCSLGALAVARGNCARHAPGVGLIAGDLLAPVRGRSIDLVVSNPPYVSGRLSLPSRPRCASSSRARPWRRVWTVSRCSGDWSPTRRGCSSRAAGCWWRSGQGRQRWCRASSRRPGATRRP